MNERTVWDRLEKSELATRHLERHVRLTTYTWLLIVLILFLAICTHQPQAAQQLDRETGVLRVRQLVIVDKNGVNRIVVGPVPDPQVMGKRWKRRSPATGIQLNDASGNERGGFLILDDSSVLMGVDDDSGGERADLYYMPHRGSGVTIQGERGGGEISLLVRPGSDPSAIPKIVIMDRAGKKIASLPRSK